MKIKTFISAILIAFIAITTTSCNKSEDGFKKGDVKLFEVSTKNGSEGLTTFILDNINSVFSVTNALTADEIEFLYAMREDEKLCRDIALAFASKFPSTAQFSGFATAESNHIGLIERVLNYYEIQYPALSNAGVFEDTKLQDRYNELILAENALEAFGVLALIQEEDLVAYKAVRATVKNPNLIILLDNMVRSSSNHLRAAVRQITFLGGTYTPSKLTQEEADQIINSAFNQCQGYGIQNGNRGHCNGNKGGQGHKGSVNRSGNCTSTVNGSNQTSGNNQGSGCGKGYRGGI